MSAVHQLGFLLRLRVSEVVSWLIPETLPFHESLDGDKPGVKRRTRTKRDGPQESRSEECGCLCPIFCRQVSRLLQCVRFLASGPIAMNLGASIPHCRSTYPGWDEHRCSLHHESPAKYG